MLHRLNKMSKMSNKKHLQIGDALENLTSTKLDKITELPVSKLVNLLIEILERTQGPKQFKQGLNGI